MTDALKNEMAKYSESVGCLVGLVSEVIWFGSTAPSKYEETWFHWGGATGCFGAQSKKYKLGVALCF